jgi:catechol 2,3-dioxygenase-like lactoylglutathione lyase family enzyme
MDTNFETISAADFGRALTGLGINILVRDVPGLATFLTEVFGMRAHRMNADFAILTYGQPVGDAAGAGGQPGESSRTVRGPDVFQLHADGTYHSNALPSLLPESGPRGGGLELRLYETDPDEAAARAQALARAGAHAATILHPPENKPHGLRECIILCENGYAWVPSRRLTEEEATAVG